MFLRRSELELLRPCEIDSLVSGEEVYKWEDFRTSVIYVKYTPNSINILDFWEVFEEFSESMKKRFLFFTTGSERVPAGGLGMVNLTIEKAGSIQDLPVAHTCAKVLTLPDYCRKSVLRKKLTLALQYTDGFGIL